ncbi:MAG: hypothetical protein JWM43_882 [Acidobacteriaceae bacterium]|nr:hypothetical protein [Acidobacteriaceae bacterium]
MQRDFRKTTSNCNLCGRIRPKTPVVTTLLPSNRPVARTLEPCCRWAFVGVAEGIHRSVSNTTKSYVIEGRANRSVSDLMELDLSLAKIQKEGMIILMNRPRGGLTLRLRQIRTSSPNRSGEKSKQRPLNQHVDGNPEAKSHKSHRREWNRHRDWMT